MKRITITLLALIMVFTLGVAAEASTIGVNVEPGYSVSVDKTIDPSDDAWTVTGNFGINDRLLLKLGYTTDVDMFYFGGRYELRNNLALGFGVDFGDDNDAFTLDLRGKKNISNRWDIVGVLSYTNPDEADDLISLLGQLEYKLGKIGALNLGLDYLTDGDDSETYYLVGAEFYISKVCLYLDYTANTDDSDDDKLTAGVEFKF
jgi:hypothetical protein